MFGPPWTHHDAMPEASHEADAPVPKAELLDPAGKAVAGALSRLGKTEFSAVRIGKRFELTVDGAVTASVIVELTPESMSGAVHTTVCAI